MIFPQQKESYDPEITEAIEHYQQLIKKYPDKKELNFNLGNLHFTLGDMEKATAEYQQAFMSDNPEVRANALYNLGNVNFQEGKLQESVDLYKDALKLKPKDEDIKYNYELSRQMLEAQEQQQKQDQEDQEKQEDPQEEQQDSQDSRDQESDGNQSEKSESESDENKFEEQKEEENQPDEGENEPEDKESKPKPQPQELTDEQKLNRKEAEAILNALKANEENLKDKKYYPVGRIKLEKDW